jgi:Bacteriophage HK97-gp10, putative tail-component
MANISAGSGVTADLYRITRRLTLQVANDLVDEIRRLAPVETGKLRESYQVREGAAYIGEAIVYTDVEYAVHQEYGTLFQSGTPHVRPALEIIKRKYGIASIPDVSFRDVLEP